MRVIGIDPGLRHMGWGVVEIDGAKTRHIANGVCNSEGSDLAMRLLSLHQQLTVVFLNYVPDTAAVEQTFVNTNGAATLKLGQARGIAMLVPAQHGLTVAEYAPNTVKKVVVGVGHHVTPLVPAGAGIGGSARAWLPRAHLRIFRRWRQRLRPDHSQD